MKCRNPKCKDPADAYGVNMCAVCAGALDEGMELAKNKRTAKDAWEEY